MGSGTSKSAPPVKKPTTAHIRGQEVKLWAGDAHPISLAVLDLVKEADLADDKKDYETMLSVIRQATQLLKEVPEDAADYLAVLVSQREGCAHQRLRNPTGAKAAYGKAIQTAELMVADKRPQIYMVLQRYCDAVMALSSLWEQEAVISWKSTTAAPAAKVRLSSSSQKGSGTPVLQKQEEQVLGDANTAGATNATETSVREPAVVPSSSTAAVAPTDEQRARARAVHIYGPCEMALLRCIELVERGDHRQSELLILPLLELSRVYEALMIFPRAVLIIRRCIGILCVRFGHDHMRVIDLNARCERLIVLRDEQLLVEAVIKLQSLARMFSAMHRLEATLRRPVRRHQLASRVAREQQQARNTDFLSSYATLLWQQNGSSTAGGSNLNKTVTSTTQSSSTLSGTAGSASGGAAMSSSYGGGGGSGVHGTTSPVMMMSGASSPSKAKGLPPASPNVASLSVAATTSAGASRPSSSMALGMRQTALINAGFTPSFARSSFAGPSSRPGSATGLPPTTSRPGSGAVRTANLSPQPPSADQRPQSTASGASQDFRGRSESLRLSLAALSAPATSAAAATTTNTNTTYTTTIIRGKSDSVAGQEIAVKRGRLRSWAAHDLSQ